MEGRREEGKRFSVSTFPFAPRGIEQGGPQGEHVSMKLDVDTVHHRDCLRGLGELPPGCVDLAFADPPFNIGYTYDVYDDRKGYGEYLKWSQTWMAAVVRVLKPTGTFWLAIGDEYAAELKVIAQKDLGLICRSWVVWFYTF